MAGAHRKGQSGLLSRDRRKFRIADAIGATLPEGVIEFG